MRYVTTEQFVDYDDQLIKAGTVFEELIHREFGYYNGIDKGRVVFVTKSRPPVRETSDRDSRI